MSTEQNEEVKRLLLKAEMDLEQAAEFEATHKKAFRVAFDYLHACFPPTRDEAYWEAAIKKLAKLVDDNQDNLLVKNLCLGVYDYLGEIVKDLPVEQKEDEGTNEN